jgi:hypothetical protein
MSDEACSRGSRIQGKEEQRESETQGEGVGKKWWSVYRRVVLTSKSEGVPVGCRGMKGMTSQKMMSARNSGTELSRSRKDR